MGPFQWVLGFWRGRGISNTESSRKRKFDDTSFVDSKVRRIDEPDANGETSANLCQPNLVPWRSHQEAVNMTLTPSVGQVHISNWNMNGKENNVKYSNPMKNSTVDHCRQNHIKNSDEGIQVLEDFNRIKAPHPTSSKTSQKVDPRCNRVVDRLSQDCDEVKILSCSRKEPVVRNGPVSPDFNKKNDDDVQVIEVQSSARKQGRCQRTATPTRRPFKALDHYSSSRARSALFTSKRQTLHSPEESDLVKSMGQSLYRPQSSLLSLNSSCYRNSNTTLNQLRRAEEHMTMDDLFHVFGADRNLGYKMNPTQESRVPNRVLVPHPRGNPRPLTNHSLSPLRTMKDLSIAPESTRQVPHQPIPVPVERITRDEPSTSATRYQAEGPDLQYLGHFTGNAEKPLESVHSDLEEICAKYAEKERALREEVSEYTKKSKMLEDRNKQAVLFKKLSNHSDIAKSFKSYLRLVEELPDEKDVEEIPPLPELTADMEAEIHKALNSSLDAVLVSAFNLTIKGRDMRTLRPLTWLNDEVINFYMSLLIERGKEDKYPSVHAFNTFFFPKLLSTGYDSLKRWTKKVDIFAHDFLLVPVHRGMHWCMAIIDVKEKVIRYYDSMNGRYPLCADALLNYLQKESLDKKKQAFDTTGWEKEHAEDIPQQNNGSDCGMFACMYAEYVSRGVPITFSQDDMPYFRRKAVYEILKAKLLC